MIGPVAPPNSKKFRIARWLAKRAVGIGTSYVVKTSLTNLTSPETRLEKTLVTVGSFGIGGVVGHAVDAQTEETITFLTDSWCESNRVRKEAMELFKEAKETKEL
jgi:hypothetical protein